MIVPSSNTVFEPVASALVAEIPSLSAHFTRVRVTRIDADEDASAQFDAGLMTDAATLLADAGVDAIAWAGTSGTWLGLERDAELARALASATNVRVTTSTQALLAACHALRARRVALLTPYVPKVAASITEQLDRVGLQVVHEAHLGISENRAFADVGPDKLRMMAYDAAAAGPDAILLVCTNLCGAPLVNAIEEETGTTVLDSAAATLWHSCMLAGSSRPVAGYGRLLAMALQ